MKITVKTIFIKITRFFFKLTDLLNVSIRDAFKDFRKLRPICRLHYRIFVHIRLIVDYMHFSRAIIYIFLKIEFKVEGEL